MTHLPPNFTNASIAMSDECIPWAEDEGLGALMTDGWLRSFSKTRSTRASVKSPAELSWQPGPAEEEEGTIATEVAGPPLIVTWATLVDDVVAVVAAVAILPLYWMVRNIVERSRDVYRALHRTLHKEIVALFRCTREMESDVRSASHKRNKIVRCSVSFTLHKKNKTVRALYSRDVRCTF